MKKLASLILALSLCLALAVPAFAADYGVIDLGEYKLETAKVEKQTLSFTAYNWETEKIETSEETVNVISVKPGTGFVDDTGEASFFIWYLENGGYHVVEAVAESLYGDETIDTLINRAKGEAPDSEKYLFACGVGTDGLKRFLTIGDGAAAPAQTTTSAPAATTDKPAQTTAPTTTAPAATPAGSGTYTAQKYDTYGKLAVNNYGTYAVTKALQKANNYKTLKAGVAVTLPDTLGKVARIAPAVAGEGEKLYTVLAGDTLGTIAKAYFGNSAQYKAIFERNADRLKNANTIYEGQIIVLPAK